MNPIFVRFLEYPVLPRVFNWGVSKIFGKTETATAIADVAAEATQHELEKRLNKEDRKEAELVPAYDATAEQALANKSPRIGNKTLPAGDPTIKITGYKWGKGSVTFESKTCGSGKVPEGHEYLFIITNGTKTENAAASHGVRDSRLWSKVENPISFMITLVKDKRNTIVEYSNIINNG